MTSERKQDIPPPLPPPIAPQGPNRRIPEAEQSSSGDNAPNGGRDETSPHLSPLTDEVDSSQSSDSNSSASASVEEPHTEKAIPTTPIQSDSVQTKPALAEASKSSAVPDWVLFAVLLGPWFLPSFGSTPQQPWGFAVLGVIASGVLFSMYLAPNENDSSRGIKAFFFTFFVSLPVLLTLQASVVEHAKKTWQEVWASAPPHPVAKVCTFISWGIGNAYASVLDPEQEATLSLIPHLVAMFFSVALCEELLKLAPVIFLVTTGKASSLTVNGIAFVGASSGVGFGIIEGVLYHYEFYRPGEFPMTVYILRFFSLAALHGCWTVLSSVTLLGFQSEFRNAGDGWESFVGRAFIVLTAMAFPMALHSVYNVSQSHIPLLHLVAVIVTGVAVIRVIHGKTQVSEWVAWTYQQKH